MKSKKSVNPLAQIRGAKKRRDNPEFRLQCAVVKYLKLQYPKVRFCASAGGMRTSMAQAGKMKAMGYSPGFPDLFIAKAKFSLEFHIVNPEESEDANGLFLELKSPTGTTSKEQKEWAKYLINEGFAWHICKSFDEAKKIIDNYLK